MIHTWLCLLKYTHLWVLTSSKSVSFNVSCKSSQDYLTFHEPHKVINGSWKMKDENIFLIMVLLYNGKKKTKHIQSKITKINKCTPLPKQDRILLSRFLALGVVFWIVSYENFHFSVMEHNNWKKKINFWIESVTHIRIGFCQNASTL